MSSPHQDHGRPAAPEQPADAHGHEQHADADTHGQAMPHAHAHSAVDEDHQVHTHGEHAGHSTAMFRNKFWLSLVLAIPVVVFSPMVGHLLGYSVPDFPGSAWIPPVRAR
jgi:Cu2+-exporting ATPase